MKDKIEKALKNPIISDCYQEPGVFSIRLLFVLKLMGHRKFPSSIITKLYVKKDVYDWIKSNKNVERVFCNSCVEDNYNEIVEVNFDKQVLNLIDKRELGESGKDHFILMEFENDNYLLGCY